VCFSAAASFTASAVTGAAGLLTLSRVRSWRQIPLAAIPLVFASQQTIEGALWLDIGNARAAAAGDLLPNAFAFVALGFWPLMASFSALLVEQQRWRRLAIAILFCLAIPVGLYGFYDTQAHPYAACVAGHSIQYLNGKLYPSPLIAGYLACTIGPMILSSYKALKLFGAILALGLFASLIAFYEAMFSVWCFFAAAASAVLVVHFTGRGRSQAQKL